VTGSERGHHHVEGPRPPPVRQLNLLPVSKGILIGSALPQGDSAREGGWKKRKRAEGSSTGPLDARYTQDAKRLRHLLEKDERFRGHEVAPRTPPDVRPMDECERAADGARVRMYIRSDPRIGQKVH